VSRVLFFSSLFSNRHASSDDIFLARALEDTVFASAHDIITQRSYLKPAALPERALTSDVRSRRLCTVLLTDLNSGFDHSNLNRDCAAAKSVGHNNSVGDWTLSTDPAAAGDGPYNVVFLLSCSLRLYY
jgi:hypothetical protein